MAEASRRKGFPLIIVRLCLAIYAGPRIISVDGAVTAAFRLGTSIVTGCSFATTLLRVVLIECLDMGSRLYPMVSFYVYVDDIDIGAYGHRDHVPANICGATRFIVLALEREILAEVSRVKSSVLGSSASLRGALSAKLSSLRLQVGHSGKKLGTD